MLFTINYKFSLLDLNIFLFLIDIDKLRIINNSQRTDRFSSKKKKVVPHIHTHTHINIFNVLIIHIGFVSKVNWPGKVKCE